MANHEPAKRRGRTGGRPSLGRREQFGVRVPSDLAARVRDDADAQGLFYSEYLTNIIAAHYGRDPEFAPRISAGETQEELPMAETG